MSERIIVCETPEGCTCGAPASTPAGMHHCDCSVHPGWCGRDGCLPCEQNGQVDTHWGHVDARPTSLHGNGAASFSRTSLDPAEVTCRLCVKLLASTESLAWIDRQGDVWRIGEDGLMRTPETAPFPREYVEKKWGPLRLVDPLCRPGTSTAGGTDV